MAIAQTLPRVFKLGAARIADPCPGQPLSEAVRLLARNYPQFRCYRLYEEDGVVEDDAVFYVLKSPPAKDNG